MNILPQHVVEQIGRSAHASQPLRVFWVTLQADRDAFAKQLTMLSETKPIVPCTLRTSGFSDPNSVMNDVTGVLDQERAGILDLKKRLRTLDGVDVVILSRSDLKLAVTSSPILLPDWFPVAPGRTVTARIEDLTWTSTTSLKDSSLGLDDLHRILYEIEGLLIERIRNTSEDDLRRVQAFWDLIRNKDRDAASPIRAISEIEKKLDQIENPTSYRPSIRSGTIVGRLWSHANAYPPEKLVKTAKALTKALSMDQRIVVSESSLLAVLNRPTNPIEKSYDRWAFSLIITLRSACQLVTAAAHADEYPRFPVMLLQSTFREISRFLDSSAAELARVET